MNGSAELLTVVTLHQRSRKRAGSCSSPPNSLPREAAQTIRDRYQASGETFVNEVPSLESNVRLISRQSTTIARKSDYLPMEETEGRTDRAPGGRGSRRTPEDRLRPKSPNRKVSLGRSRSNRRRCASMNMGERVIQRNDRVVANDRKYPKCTMSQFRILGPTSTEAWLSRGSHVIVSTSLVRG